MSPNLPPRSSYADITKSGDYYFSITIPALIVATYGGGTGLADTARMSGIDGLFRKRQSKKIRRNRRGNGSLRRTFAGKRGCRRRMGFVARTIRTKSLKTSFLYESRLEFFC